MSKELLREDEEQHSLLIKVCFSGGELRGVVIFAPDRLTREKSEIWSWYACFYYWKWTWGVFSSICRGCRSKASEHRCPLQRVEYKG